MAGRSAVRLARLVRDQEVGGSNPLAPTIQNLTNFARNFSIKHSRSYRMFLMFRSMN